MIPPPHLAEVLTDAEVIVKKGGRFNDAQTTHVFLRAWAGLIDDIGRSRPYGSDDYQHSIGYRTVLHRLLVVLHDAGHSEALAWLQREVDRLDQVFLERSSYDEDSLILRSDKTNPSYWFLRRLPNDDNIVEHLRMIQPKSGRSTGPATTVNEQTPPG